MGKSTISIAIFNSKLLNYQRVTVSACHFSAILGGRPVAVWIIPLEAVLMSTLPTGQDSKPTNLPSDVHDIIEMHPC